MAPKKYFYITLGMLFVGLTILAAMRLVVVREADKDRYYKARESRRGSVRKAKDTHRALSITQERTGVVRQLWLPEANSLEKREFFLEAPRAEIVATIDHAANNVDEIFEDAKGFLQEDLYWEIPATKERVVPDLQRQDTWLYEGQKGVSVPSSFIKDISPRQQVRYFDAARAEWSISGQVVTLYVVGFCVADMPGHVSTSVLDPKYIVMEGSADDMTFFLQQGREGKNRMTSSGMKLRTPRSPSPLNTIAQ